MAIDIDHLTEAQLVDLNHRIVERLRFLHQMRSHKRMLDFRSGGRVSFASQTGAIVTGTLTRYSKRTVTVVADSGERWNVSPNLLQPVAERAQDGAAKVMTPLKK